MTDSATREIVITGTFDVRNYGDLLFPLIAAHKLRCHGITISPASPSGRNTGWCDAMPPVDIQTALFSERRFDGILIGGGNIIHARPVTLPDYSTGTMANWAYGSLWLGATLAAGSQKVPLAYNAPGIPHAFTSEEQPMVQAAFAAASYASVRDQASADLLTPFVATVVPDTALDLAQIWSKRELEANFRILLDRKGANAACQFVAIHVKSRSVHGEVETIAPLVEAYSAKTGLVPILIGIGHCHDDHLATNRLAEALKIPSVNLSEPLGLREIAAAIACSTRYVGASMHGYITARAYGIPGIIVGQPRLPKMLGLLAHLSSERDEVSDWETGLLRSAERSLQQQTDLPERVRAELDAHWRSIADVLTAPVITGTAQAAFRTLAAKGETNRFTPS